MAVSLILSGHMKDLGGGLIIRRLLPAAERQAVGPFPKLDWQAQRMGKVPGEIELIPLPA